MSGIDAATAQRLLPLLRSLRESKALRERSPGVFHLGTAVFVQLRQDGETVHAELRRPRGGVDRHPVETPVEQRRLLDEIRRRLAREDDD